MAMMLRGTLGLNPWDVFHQGLSHHVGWSYGSVVVAASFAVLLLWIPLRQMPGLGTLANAVWVGLATDAALAVFPAPGDLLGRTAFMLGGVLLNGVASALYIGSQLGPGPRDGLMTGLHERTGVSLRVVRTGLEVVVLAVGWALGGTVGVGTVLYALAIGPLVQFLLPRCTVRLTPARQEVRPSPPRGSGRARRRG